MAREFPPVLRVARASRQASDSRAPGTGCGPRTCRSTCAAAAAQPDSPSDQYLSILLSRREVRPGVLGSTASLAAVSAEKGGCESMSWAGGGVQKPLESTQVD